MKRSRLLEAEKSKYEYMKSTLDRTQEGMVYFVSESKHRTVTLLDLVTILQRAMKAGSE